MRGVCGYCFLKKINLLDWVGLLTTCSKELGRFESVKVDVAGKLELPHDGRVLSLKTKHRFKGALGFVAQTKLECHPSKPALRLEITWVDDGRRLKMLECMVFFAQRVSLEPKAVLESGFFVWGLSKCGLSKCGLSNCGLNKLILVSSIHDFTPCGVSMIYKADVKLMRG